MFLKPDSKRWLAFYHLMQCCEPINGSCKHIHWFDSNQPPDYPCMEKLWGSTNLFRGIPIYILPFGQHHLVHTFIPLCMQSPLTQDILSTQFRSAFPNTATCEMRLLTLIPVTPAQELKWVCIFAAGYGSTFHVHNTCKIIKLVCTCNRIWLNVQMQSWVADHPHHEHQELLLWLYLRTFHNTS